MTHLLQERALLEYDVGDFDQADAFLERFLEYSRGLTYRERSH